LDVVDWKLEIAGKSRGRDEQKLEVNSTIRDNVKS
jgi:hypothetical protein